MKDNSINQPWPRSARVTVWVLGVVFSFVTFLAFAYVPPCEECMRRDAESRTTWPITPPSWFPVASLLVEQLKEQRSKHPEDFPPPRTHDDEFIKSLLDADDTVKYLKAIGYESTQYTPNTEDIPMETPALVPTKEDIPDLHKMDFEYPVLEPTA